MVTSIIIFIGLDHMPAENVPSSVVELARSLIGFGTTPIHFVLMGQRRHEVEYRQPIMDALSEYMSSAKPANWTSPSAMDVLLIDASPADLPEAKRPSAIVEWLAIRVAELTDDMHRERSVAESCSSGHSVEVNHGSDTEAVVRNAVLSNPSPLAGSLGSVIVVDSLKHDIPMVGEGHCVAIGSPRISAKDAHLISQIARRTPSVTKRLDFSADTLSGIVKRYNPTKGFGFITVGGQDVFVHQSHIVSDGFRGLNVGATVTLDVEIVKGRPEARSVRQQTLYVPTFENDVIVEGTHKSAGEPSAIRRERKKQRCAVKEAKQPKAVPPSPKQKTAPNAEPEGSSPSRAASSQLVFAGDSIPYTFRAHDGTVYCFPMPVLVHEGSYVASSNTRRAKPIPARAVSGGFTQQGVAQYARDHAGFSMYSPHVEAHGSNRMISGGRASPYDSHSSRLDPGSPPFIPGHSASNSYAHNPCQTMSHEVGNASLGMTDSASTLPSLPVEQPIANHSNSSYAEALVRRSEMSTSRANDGQLTAGVIQVPRRQR